MVSLRFLLLWLIVSSLAYGVIYVMRKRDRRAARKLGSHFLISAGIGLVLVVPMFLINTFSGV